MKRFLFSMLLSAGLVVVLFNQFVDEIIDFNSSVRTFVMTGNWTIREFDEDGIPLYRNARVGDYRSPFYIVHYGLEYSEACREHIVTEGKYHWLEDDTLTYWHSSPLQPTVERFRSSVDWVVNNVEYDSFGNAHLFYDFDWPYPNHPGGVLRSPWWSGLTEGHAITLLLRAADCFSDDRYASLAEEFYHSILTPVDEGGSLLTFNGYPWVEEYVDSSAPMEELSRVFNGMVYAYFGVEAYERFTGIPKAAAGLRDSIFHNYDAFDFDYWSYYDAIGSRANIKYHRINLALLRDQRLQGYADPAVLHSWDLGARFPVIFYGWFGPGGLAKWHFYSMLLISWFALTVFFFLAMKRIFRQRWSN